MQSGAARHVTRGNFATIGYMFVVLHTLFGGIGFISLIVMEVSEREKFYCFGDSNFNETYKTKLDKACLSRYNGFYHSCMSFPVFFGLSFGLAPIMSVAYGVGVWEDVANIASSCDGNQSDLRNQNSSKIFRCYFGHHIARSLFGIISTVLQHTVLYPHGFSYEYDCNINVTSLYCENNTASVKQFWSVYISIINVAVTVAFLFEMIYLLNRLKVLNRPSGLDHELVCVYFLRKPYNEREPREFSLAQETSDRNGEANNQPTTSRLDGSIDEKQNNGNQENFTQDPILSDNIENRSEMNPQPDNCNQNNDRSAQGTSDRNVEANNQPTASRLHGRIDENQNNGNQEDFTQDCLSDNISARIMLDVGSQDDNNHNRNQSNIYGYCSVV